MQNHTGPFSKKPVRPLDGPFDNAPITSNAPAPSASSGTAVPLPPGAVHRVSPRLARVLLTLMLVAICLGLGFDFWASHMDLMGESGLTSHLVFGIGIALTGVTLLTAFAIWIIRIVGDVRQDPQATKVEAKDYAIRFLNVLLNIAVYGGLSFFVIANLVTFASASPGTKAVHVVVIVASVAGIVLFRRWRVKRHPVKLKGLGVLASIVLVLVLGVVFLPLGLSNCGDYVADKIDGPQTGSFVYQKKEYVTPHGRGAMLETTHYQVQFRNADTGTYLSVDMTPDEYNRLSWTFDAKTPLPLTYYAHSRVLVGIGSLRA